ncbi:MAG TPA: PIN domain-containing protein [Pirellulales bacterium]
MRALLDTHALYWYIEGDQQLSASARAAIQDASNEVLISPASYWEMALVENIAIVSNDAALDAYGVTRLW